MNAIRPAVSTAMKKATVIPMRRFASTYPEVTKRAVPRKIVEEPVPVKVTEGPVPPFQKLEFKKVWLSDASTYPLIFIVVSFVPFVVGIWIHALKDYEDVTIDPKKRSSILRYWGQEERPSIIRKYFASNALPPEGLGIDHEKWLKERNQH